MPENTNINNNSAVVVVGRTAPVPTGQQSSEKSIPVVIASDQEAIPVEEQNKQQSEVALSLLGIPRSEVALGIFADVNTYDVNPTEWTASPEQLSTIPPTSIGEYKGVPGQQDWGLNHVPSEAGAHIEAPANEYAILTSKRFFRYQPGRVSAGTFGVKFGRSPYTVHTSASDYPSGTNGQDFLLAETYKQVRNPSIKKYGVFDKFDGYYFESVNEGRGDNFCCIRRTQSLIQQKSKDFFYATGSSAQTNPKQFGTKQYEDYGNMEVPGQGYRGDAVILRDGLINIHAGLFDPSLLKEKKEIPISGVVGTEMTLAPEEIGITNFTYNNVTGLATVTTNGDHGLNEGDSVTVRDMLISCNTGSKLYPNKYAQTVFRINTSTTNSFQVFIGESLYDASTFQQKYVSGGTTSKISNLNAGSTLTIADFEYTNASGAAKITTSGAHGLEEGDQVRLQSINLNGGVTYPTSQDPDVFTVRRVNSTLEFEVGVGKPSVAQLDETTNTYASGGTATVVSPSFQTSKNITSTRKLTPTNASYDPNTGVMTLTIANHGLLAGDGIRIDDYAITFTCEADNNATNHSYPRPSDPASGKFLPVTVINSNTISVVVLDTIPSVTANGRTAHTFVSAETSSITVSGFSYNPATGFVNISVSSHGYSVGDRIKLADILTSCSYGPKTYPAKDDEDTFSVFDVGSNTFSFQLFTSTISHTYQGGGRVISQGLRPGSSIYVYTNDKTISNAVDGGIYFVDSVKGSKVTLTKAPTNGNDLSVFPSGDTTPINFGTTSYKLTPTGANYDPNTGVMTVTIPSHGLEDGDKVKFDDYSIVFTCAADGNATTHAYPRPTDPASGQFLAITNVTINTFDVVVLDTIPSVTANGRTQHTFDSAVANSVSTSVSPYVVTPAPFILPNTVNNSYAGIPDTEDPDIIVQNNPYGCFPYQYVYGDDAASVIGYINTAVKLTTAEGANTVKTGIDFVNNNLLKDWIYNHVQARYWTVYEYRVPRSRFSGEKVDGQADNDVLYSDVVYSNSTQNFPGENVQDLAAGTDLIRTSNWNLNPQNVTMYKVEFSWYGAVGALFLAYVPLDSGEARWVRVHHLRASNQLKVAALGNPTLPITYMVYGGGTQFSYGYRNDARNLNYIANSSSYSEYLVKYGASYYIDGGDRGTVRLFNYATPAPAEIYGSRLQFNLNSADNFGQGNPGVDPYPHLVIGNGTNVTNLAVADYTYYMGATVITPNREPGLKVIWIDTAAGKIYLNRNINDQTGGDFFLVVDRPRVITGLKCREVINGVRNRVQVYPTRLSIGNSGSYANVKLLKSPVFQTKTTPNGVFNTTYTNSTPLDIGSISKPTEIENPTNRDYIPLISSTYGYFRGYYDGDSSNVITVFGLLRRDASGNYFFNAYEKTSLSVLIFGDFLRAGEFYEPNPNTLDASGVVPTTTPLTALSAIAISDEQRSPIPGTGQQITTLFTPGASGEQFELQQFFDYNKDYLSFPLTEDVETLFILASESNLYNGTSIATNMSAAITWEEQ
jgi:hypothetical protein